MIKLGAQLAVEEADARFKAKGFDLQFAPQDDQAQPDVGVAVARRLVNDPDILALVGHFNSGVTIPTSEVYKDFDLVMVSPGSTNPRVTERGLNNVNRVCGRDDVQGPVGAEFAVNDLKAKRILVIHDKTAYGQGIAQAFRDKAVALGAKVVGLMGTEEKTNFQSLILQMRVLNPDLVYFGGIYDQAGVLLKQMREKGVKALFLGPDGLESSAFVDIAQGAVVGAYYTTVAGPAEKYPSAKTFTESFRAKYGRAPEAYALYSYDAANVVLDGIEQAIAANGGQEADAQAGRGSGARGKAGRHHRPHRLRQPRRPPSGGLLDHPLRRSQVPGQAGEIHLRLPAPSRQQTLIPVHCRDHSSLITYLITGHRSPVTAPRN
jgi:branched-chain amino acid transport system substrate-binding protein